MEKSKLAFNKIIYPIFFLAKQGLALRGHKDKSVNLNQLLKLRSEDSTELHYWLSRTKYQWISCDIINEVFSMFTL